MPQTARVAASVKPTIPSLGKSVPEVFDGFMDLQKKGYLPVISVVCEGTFFLTADGKWARQRDGGWTYEMVKGRNFDQRLFEWIRHGWASIFGYVGNRQFEMHRATGQAIPGEA